jgi:integrase
MPGRNARDLALWKASLLRIGVTRAKDAKDTLTERIIQAARANPTGTRYRLADGVVPGMYLLVTKGQPLPPEPGATPGERWRDADASFWLTYRVGRGREAPRRNEKIGTAGIMSLDEARRAAKALLVAAGAGTDPQEERRAKRAASQTLRSYLDAAYQPQVLAHRKRPRIAHHFQNVIEKTWTGLLDKPMKAITRGDIEGVLTARLAAGKKNSTVRLDWCYLRALLRHAHRSEAIDKLPLLGQPEPLKRALPAKRVRWLGGNEADPTERERFWTALAGWESPKEWGGDFLRTVVKIAFATGMRRNEILGLTAEMISLRDRRIMLPEGYTKNGKGRPVPLNDDALRAITEWKHRGIDGRLFPGAMATLEGRVSGWEFPQLVRQAGIQNFHFHDIRHSVASYLVSSGVALPVVKDVLGHSSIAMTERYAHLAPQHVANALYSLRSIPAV